ncbi:TPA: NAD(P)/FAD-dependent oxidoreductase [Streptococcus agalactiae]
MKHYQTIIIGAGAAGIGFGSAMQRLGLTNFLIIEKGHIGESFLRRPRTTQFITPSFTTNGFGFPDLNAVIPDTSPAFSFEKEHLSGVEYARYLQLVAAHYNLPIQNETSVLSIDKRDSLFVIKTSKGDFSADYLIMATGEFQNPNTIDIKGADLGMHYGQVDNFHIKSDNPFIIIGGNESACDALTHLVYLGNQVELYTDTFGRKESNPDPSISLSPLTKERLKHIQDHKKEYYSISEGKKAIEIKQIGKQYQVTFDDGSTAESFHKPILSTGFLNTCHLIDGIALFEYDKNQLPIVTEDDESTIVNNCFLIGPSLRQRDTIFCYIYKFRQRFVPVINHIAQREGIILDEDTLEFFKENQMYLDNLACCDVNCDC